MHSQAYGGDEGEAPDDGNYVTQVLPSLNESERACWDALWAGQGPEASHFMKSAFLTALQSSNCASPATGWTPRYFVLKLDGNWIAACVVYVKTHSRGEYVFDHGWAQAYARHGLDYYPKALIALPFTPVPGNRLLAVTRPAKVRLLEAVRTWCQDSGLSSLHLLFGSEDDLEVCVRSGMTLRHTVQFHWFNTQLGLVDFNDFLNQLTQEKRKKIRQERRKVVQAGVRFRAVCGAEITPGDWDFFYRCYLATYLEHGSPPYLNREFFRIAAEKMPNHWLMFIAERNRQDIACSLIALNPGSRPTAYGRYWGSLERVDCLHFEACYYQPIDWCIANRYHRFEGGAQGEHKLARGLLPVKVSSAHWLARPDFQNAIEQYLEEEGQMVRDYIGELETHSPMRRPA